MARPLVSGISTTGLALLLLTGCLNGEVCCALPTEPSTVSHTPQKTAQNTAPSAGDIIVVSQLGTLRQPESNTVYLRDVTDPVLFLYGAPGNYSLSHPRDGLWLAHPDGSFAALSGKEALTAPTWADLVAAIDSV